MRRIPLALVFLVLVCGCRSFGGRPVTVNIDSDPPGAEVYLVPLIVWDTSGRTGLLDNFDKLAAYRAGGSQLTPLSMKVGNHEQVLILRRGDLIGYKPVTPDEGSSFRLRLQPQ